MKLLCALAATLLMSGAPDHSSSPHTAPATPAQSPDAALKQLMEGNSRFRDGRLQNLNRDQARRCDTFANGQHPIATVLSCADSRVPVELVCDAGIGDLFVIRVAGNVADTDEVGTIEYGVEHLHTPLVVVLGHSKCGAVTAVVNGSHVTENIAGLVDNIAPAAQKTRKQHADLQGDALVAQTVQMNVWQSIEDLLTRSPTVREAVNQKKVRIVGGVYDLHSGAIEWLGEHPQQSTFMHGSTKPASEHSTHRPGSNDAHPKSADSHSDAGHQKASQPTSKRPHNWFAFGGIGLGAIVLSAGVIHFVRPRRTSATEH